MLPQGLAGLVGMLRNWTFTIFFCMSELWGDVCMGLLFWGLANEITSLADAATLYPLFGLGANLAQALAGIVLKVGGCWLCKISDIHGLFEGSFKGFERRFRGFL